MAYSPEVVRTMPKEEVAARAQKFVRWLGEVGVPHGPFNIEAFSRLVTGVWGNGETEASDMRWKLEIPNAQKNRLEAVRDVRLVDLRRVRVTNEQGISEYQTQMSIEEGVQTAVVSKTVFSGLITLECGEYGVGTAVLRATFANGVQIDISEYLTETNVVSVDESVAEGASLQ